MDTVKISNEQAKEFAWSIFSEIENYVNEHQEEYELFLLEENRRANL